MPERGPIKIPSGSEGWRCCWCCCTLEQFKCSHAEAPEAEILSHRLRAPEAGKRDGVLTTHGRQLLVRLSRLV